MESRVTLTVGPLDECGRNLIPDDHDPQDALIAQKREAPARAASIVAYRPQAGARPDAVPRLTVVINLNMA